MKTIHIDPLMVKIDTQPNDICCLPNANQPFPIQLRFYNPHIPDRLQAIADLRDYFNLSISLAGVSKSFSTTDARFAQLAPHLQGARAMRQDPLECLFQFCCSSNNNIKRITNMVGIISSFDDYLGDSISMNSRRAQTDPEGSLPQPEMEVQKMMQRGVNHPALCNLSPTQTMKRQRPKSLLLSSKKLARSSPSTHPSSHSTPRHPKSIPSSKTKRSLIFPSSPPSSSSSSSSWAWEPLNIQQSELSLQLTFPTGQTFRWKQTGPAQYTGPIRSHLISLKHIDGQDASTSCIAYCVHHTPDRLQAIADLHDYLNLSISLADVSKSFSTSDARFAQLAPHLQGARVMRQDPLECLFQFLCSSNNNIKRITNMVGVISSFGDYLGSVGGFDFHEFPSLEQLSTVSEEQLRKDGFGYRAKYVVGTVKALQSKPGGGSEWLASLRDLELNEVINALCTLPGVGAKVAACIALFSLDQHHAIPVDTHVWRVCFLILTSGH